MLGRLGTALGDAGINIASAAVGLESEAGDEASDGAVLLVTTDRPVPAEVLDTITAGPEFHEARSVSL
jgi:D-3-phosphoglycerate dehydrogenase